MLKTTRLPASESLLNSCKLPAVNVNVGSDFPATGRSPTVLTGVPPNDV
jgi:hypothetical protein